MNRISKSDLEQLVKALNNTMGFDVEPHGKDERGKSKQNPNTYVLDWAYGGVALHQNMPNCADGSGSHGVRDILLRGNKKELAGRLRAFIAGVVEGMAQ